MAQLLEVLWGDERLKVPGHQHGPPKPGLKVLFGSVKQDGCYLPLKMNDPTLNDPSGCPNVPQTISLCSPIGKSTSPPEGANGPEEVHLDIFWAMTRLEPTPGGRGSVCLPRHCRALQPPPSLQMGRSQPAPYVIFGGSWPASFRVELWCPECFKTFFCPLCNYPKNSVYGESLIHIFRMKKGIALTFPN